VEKRGETSGRIRELSVHFVVLAVLQASSAAGSGSPGPQL
jgi:hypothetical protein